MDIIRDWDQIRKHYTQAFRSSFHVSIASIDSSNFPTVTPIGSLFLNRDGSGFYFEAFPTKLPRHATVNKNICILGVNSSKWFWLKSLLRGRFSSHPVIKLYGELGLKRKATEKEKYRLARRVRLTKGTKGHSILWKGLDQVREISFTKAEPINLAQMTAKL